MSRQRKRESSILHSPKHHPFRGFFTHQLPDKGPRNENAKDLRLWHRFHLVKKRQFC
jgi:hypothetical protein